MVSSPVSNPAILRHLATERDTAVWAAQLARGLRGGTAIALSGDLGAGKTTLVRGLLRALGWQGVVRSPTYTLVESYTLGALQLHHFDLYRFAGPEEWDDAGFSDYFGGDAVVLVEWPEMAQGVLPAMDIGIHLQVTGAGRTLAAHALSRRGEELLYHVGQGGD